MENNIDLLYGFTKMYDIKYDKMVEKVIEELKKEGFGVLSNIDVSEKFKEKLGIEISKYIILGACHPESAYEAIKKEEHIGLLLPCNVIIFEKDNKTVVSIIKPTVAMNMVKNDGLQTVAEKVEKKLEIVFENL